MPPPRPARVRADSHPWLGASMIEYTSATMPVTASTAPLRSRRGACGSAVSGTNRRVPARAAAASTTFSPNTDGHDQTSRTSPEVSSPSTADPPATAAQTLTARVRCSLAKVPVMVDRVAGITSAAPRPEDGPQGDQFGRGVSGHRDRRGRPEHRQPGQQRQPAAVAVTEGAGGEQHCGEHQRIRIDDPRQLGLCGVGRPGDARQRHVQR